MWGHPQAGQLAPRVRSGSLPLPPVQGGMPSGRFCRLNMNTPEMQGFLTALVPNP